MKILYLTFYFEPDLCAGSFRNTPLAKKLAGLVAGQAQIHVVTTQPNRYHSFRQPALSHEVSDNLVIDRVHIPAHNSGFLDQIISFKAYFLGVRKLVKREKYDLVFASSSRLFTAFVGKLVADKNKCPLYLDIRDLFTENMTEIVTNKFVRFPVILILKLIESLTFRRANHINMVSEGFRQYFSKYKKATFSFFPNGIDGDFLNVKRDVDLYEWPKIITYAGNVGEGQGLEKIIPQAAEALGSNYLFRIIGDGGRLKVLKEQLVSKNISNVELLNPVRRDKLIEHYRSSHYLFLHLNEYKSFEKVLPSKLFEYGATDIPIIAGVSGHAKKFIEKYIGNTFVFEPGNSTQLFTYFKECNYTLENRDSFVDQFQRENITRQMAVSILAYLHLDNPVKLS